MVYEETEEEKNRKLAGIIGGALVGAAIGGSGGALAGSVIGYVLAENENKKRRQGFV